VTQKLTGREEREQYTKEINTSPRASGGHNLSLEYGSAPCERGGLEDLERDGRVNCGLCCCGPGLVGPSLDERFTEDE